MCLRQQRSAKAVDKDSLNQSINVDTAHLHVSCWFRTLLNPACCLSAPAGRLLGPNIAQVTGC
jgi:hypothetical protein